ncbi:MAG: hypothetical protein Q8S33_01435 [Myxococcales bacterium]|nr:hypothetical protein [Myxococcales bacterium]
MPQLATLRDVPQLSGALTCPQVLPSREQNWASVSGAQQERVGPQTGALAGQLPQLTTVRWRPHESTPVTVPQVRPFRLQKAESDSGAQQVPVCASHTPEAPATTPQVPQEETVRKVPQRSIVESAPQVLALAWQSWASLSGLQQVRGEVVEQVAGAAQVPHINVRCPPHVSTVIERPHEAPSRVQSWASVSGVQPHLFATVTPQLVPPVHVPHDVMFRDWPHRSVMVSAPQVALRSEHSSAFVSGTQAQTFATPPWPHTAGDEQVPHETSAPDRRQGSKPGSA